MHTIGTIDWFSAVKITRYIKRKKSFQSPENEGSFQPSPTDDNLDAEGDHWSLLVHRWCCRYVVYIHCWSAEEAPAGLTSLDHSPLSLHSGTASFPWLTSL